MKFINLNNFIIETESLDFQPLVFLLHQTASAGIGGSLDFHRWPIFMKYEIDSGVWVTPQS